MTTTQQYTLELAFMWAAIVGIAKPRIGFMALLFIAVVALLWGISG